jgi:hypothetical protein
VEGATVHVFHAQRPDPCDLTGFEASASEIRVSEFVDERTSDKWLLHGVGYAELLVERLATLGAPFRVLVSRDRESGEVTVRFFGRRDGQPWSVEDLERYEAEDIMQWDVG